VREIVEKGDFMTLLDKALESLNKGESAGEVLVNLSESTESEYKEELLKWLRDEIEAYEQAAKWDMERAVADGCNSDAWDSSRIQAGAIIGLEEVIKHIRGMTEREFQLAKKKGTL
jgi:hypothetical protein